MLQLVKQYLILVENIKSEVTMKSLKEVIILVVVKPLCCKSPVETKFLF